MSMRDKRPVDELSIEELERVLAIKKREARQSQMNRMKRDGRLMAPTIAPTATLPPGTAAPKPNPNGQHAPAASSHNDTAVIPAQTTTTALVPIRTQAPQPGVSPYFEDDPSDLEPVRASSADGKAWRRFVNVSLLLVEVAAVVGLLFIAFNLFTAVDQLEEETRSAQEMSNATRQAALPTIAPTPTLRIDQVVLPGGHLIDEETGQGYINYDEIPDTIPSHLMATVQNQLLRPVVARPEQTDETALAVSIPKIGVDQTIIQGADWEALQAGVGQVLNGATPHDNDGNVVLAAHNDIYGEWFRHLDTMEAGDRFTIQTETAIHTYEVTHWEIVDPTDVHVMQNQGRPMATLISCYPYRVNTQRIVVYANRVNDV